MMEIITAGKEDIDFITEAILESEKSGTAILGWQRILNLSESEVRTLIIQILEEDIEGQEWYIPNFRILRENNTNIAALSIWKEASSGVIKSQAISWFLPWKWQASAVNLQMIQKIQIPRLKDVFQLENIYVRPEYRGKGLITALIEGAISGMTEAFPEVSKAEIQLMSENQAAMHAYIKCGFIKRAESAETDDAILTLLPGKSRTSLIREIQHGKN